MKPKISVLVPTRDRVLEAQKAIESLGKHKDIEILMYVDLDDPQLDEYMELRNKYVKLWTGESYGYSQLHKYYNFLSRQSRGDWIMLWNDDAVMTTPDWKKKIIEFDSSRPHVLSIFHEIDNLFPVISRKYYEITGHFANQAHADSWVQQVAERSGCGTYIPGIKIIHVKPNDETGQQSSYTAASNTGAAFTLPDVQNQINKDAEKVKQWLEKLAE